RGIALALGSQRAAIENPSLAASFQLRKVAPDIPILANLGAVQLNYGYGVDQCRQAVEMAQADALILHLNPLQEALQPEGDTNFASLLPKIETICRSLSVPVIIKEVGWGISASVAKRLVGAGVWAIDVAGAGGTSWSQVEMHRAEDTARADLAAIFRAWGIPTSRAIREVRAALPETPVIASGGLADGLDLAKCIALGADLGGMAGIFLRAAAQSTETVIDRIDLIREQLRVTMFAIGCKDLHALSRAELRYEEPARNG
ncbi:MAG TPA: type 2 isopentenyl-diphosphate Delta-isomerase, partial [Chloroflexi bacterium]|nr:type 2 isopentenyl-diphosphate Delta-isomerase [Chloroflexota bacterium]